MERPYFRNYWYSGFQEIRGIYVCQFLSYKLTRRKKEKERKSEEKKNKQTKREREKERREGKEDRRRGGEEERRRGGQDERAMSWYAYLHGTIRVQVLKCFNEENFYLKCEWKTLYRKWDLQFTLKDNIQINYY